MRIEELMTRHPKTVRPNVTVAAAANLMRKASVGFLPVVADDTVVGIVTDRDIVRRSTALGKDPKRTSVWEVMSKRVAHVAEDDDVEVAVRLMQARKVRRLVVLGPAGALVGIVSVDDLARRREAEHLSGRVLRHLSGADAPESRV
jgi:CBS domain-containing protein